MNQLLRSPLGATKAEEPTSITKTDVLFRSDLGI